MHLEILKLIQKLCPNKLYYLINVFSEVSLYTTHAQKFLVSFQY